MSENYVLWKHRMIRCNIDQLWNSGDNTCINKCREIRDIERHTFCNFKPSGRRKFRRIQKKKMSQGQKYVWNRNNTTITV